MPSFGPQSKEILKTIHPQLQLLVSKVVEIYDIKLLEGLRTIEQERKNVDSGVSQTMHSMHLPDPRTGLSNAIDIAPYPIDWGQSAKSLARFYILAGMMFAFAAENNITTLRWGGDWDQDWDLKDQTFDDLGHFEIPRR